MAAGLPFAVPLVVSLLTHYTPAQADWVHFTLAVHRNGNVLSGTITSRLWHGTPSDRTPPSCDRNPQGDITARMVAHGVVSDHDITFGASTATIVQVFCPGVSRYAADNFSGSIDPARHGARARPGFDGALAEGEPRDLQPRGS